MVAPPCRGALTRQVDQTRARRGRPTVIPNPVRISTTPSPSRLYGEEPVCGRLGGVTGTVVVVVEPCGNTGGDVVDVEVSATKKINLDRLLEMIGLQAEILDLKANPHRDAEGTVLFDTVSIAIGYPDLEAWLAERAPWAWIAYAGAATPAANWPAANAPAPGRPAPNAPVQGAPYPAAATQGWPAPGAAPQGWPAQRGPAEPWPTPETPGPNAQGPDAPKY